MLSPTVFATASDTMTAESDAGYVGEGTGPRYPAVLVGPPLLLPEAAVLPEAELLPEAALVPALLLMVVKPDAPVILERLVPP